MTATVPRLEPAEIALLRGALALLFYHGLVRKKVRDTERPFPVGIARWVDLTFAGTEPFARHARQLAVPLLLCYVAGMALPIVVPILALIHLCRWTLRNCQGAALHEQQGFSVVLLVQAGVHLYDTLTHGSWSFAPFESNVAVDRIAMFLSQQAIAAVYFTSGLTKMLTSGYRWILHAPRVVLQVIKSSNQKFYDRLEPTVLNRSRALVDFIPRHRFLVMIALSVGLAIELFSPFFLFGRAMNVVGACLLISFHLANERFMGLGFRTQVCLVMIFFLNIPYAVIRVFEYAGWQWT